MEKNSLYTFLQKKIMEKEMKTKKMQLIIYQMKYTSQIQKWLP